MFCNCQGIDPMGLSASLAEKNTILNKHGNITIISKMKHKNING